jgi:hypothetical protein
MNTLKKSFGWLCIATILGLGVTMLAYPAAITQLAGLAVAQTSTQWNSLKDMAQGDGQQNGVMLISPCLWNGTSCDRQRSGLAADGAAATGVPSQAPALFNGATLDRARSASATNNTQTTVLGAQQVAVLSTWSQTNTPAANTQATTSKAAGGGTVRHVATSITWCFATDTLAGAGPLNINLRDGATGAGTIMRTWIVDLPAVENSQCRDLSGLNMTGSANTAMTLEFAAAGGAASVETVSFTGYSTP